MGKQIKFFEKNFIDFDYEDVTLTATEGSEFINFVRSRSLKNAWQTTESTDAIQPILEFNLADAREMSSFILIDHNLKSYTLEAFNDVTLSYELKVTVTNDLLSTTELEFDSFFTSKLKLTILSTKVSNDQKRINRIIISQKFGIFQWWPQITDFIIDTGRVTRKSLSGKVALTRTVGALKFKLKHKNLRNKSDIELIERLYRQVQGFQVWLSGGDESQFFHAPEGYRTRDIYLMHFSSSYSPEFVKSIYLNGIEIDLDLIEVLR